MEEKTKIIKLGLTKLLKNELNDKLKADIKDLADKLLEEITKPLLLEKDESMDMAKRRRRREVKQLKNSLAEKIGIWDLIHRAEEIDKNGL